MKKLIILAHPSSHGFMRRAALAFKDKALSTGHQVDFIDLYQEPQQSFLSFEHPKEIPNDALRDKYQSKILWADELDFFFPIWWSGYPAILKNWFDCNLSAGFAFRYINGFPKGLLKPRRARVFATSGGSNLIQIIFGAPSRTITKLMLFGVCGLKTKSYIVYDSMHKRDKDHKEKMLQKIIDLAI